MTRISTLRTPVALAAVSVLLAACSDNEGGDATDNADNTPSSSSPSNEETSATAEEVALPEGVLALPGPDAGENYATLDAGRYRVPLDDSLAFEVDLPDGTAAHDGGLFLATGDFVVKTELAGEGYGVPRHPCTDQVVEPVGPTVDDLVEAIGNLPIYQLTPPETVELGGARGTYIEARVPPGYDASQCDDGAVQLPGNPGTAVAGPPPYNGRWWILDVDGQRVVVQQNCWRCRPDHLDRGARVLESITFTPTR